VPAVPEHAASPNSQRPPDQPMHERQEINQ
jgi:hypothetical protein